ncbi:trans-sulfuration enzyme family protein [Paenibacillus thermotolerans]|uniref:trans-sulfuration enzyme family protein n=1 Tax=Paenibacillus thermotolerans TaxID=3027807 RepID=UPI0023683E5D|nr:MULTISPECIES: aminotransferase class I/II-fold pyridoxal phosphate-dependent enzyme [unclassified Paenibacillus]
MEKQYKTKEDICTHLGDEYDRFLGAIVPPIFQNSLFTRKTAYSGYDYTRISNPTTEIAEEKLAALEGGEAAICLASGMAAISSAIMHTIAKDAHVICPIHAYPPAKAFLSDYLRRFGVETTFVTGTSVDEFAEAIRPNTKLIYLESPASLVFSLQDIGSLTQLAKLHGIRTIIDNTWATPLFQNPLSLGVDLVVHSSSKYLGGHSDIIGGVIVGNREMITQMTYSERALFGGIMDPHASWLLLRGLRTLPVRMKQHQAAGLDVAEFLEHHPKVEQVFHPGLPSHPQYELAKRQLSGYSGLFSFIPKGTAQGIRSMVKALRYFEEGPSWGGFESLITTPGVGITSEQSVMTGIPQGLVRLSIGLEHTDSLIEDLEEALTFL